MMPFRAYQSLMAAIEWASPYGTWIYVIVAISVVGIVITARATAISPQLRRWLLFVPRGGVFAILLLVLLNPVQRQEQGLPDQPALVHFLIDGSRSMALDRPVSRNAQVEQALDQLSRNLASNPTAPRTQWYRFGQSLAAATDASQLRPYDDASQLADALTDLSSRFSRDTPKAIIVFSDGTVDDAERLDDVARVFRDMKIPIHVYPVGDPGVRGDIAIRDLVIPPRVEVGAKVPVRGVVRGHGFVGERVMARIRSLDRPELPPLVTLPITLDGQPQPFEVTVEANPDHGTLALEVPPLAGEISDRNNVVPFRLVQAPRKLRVIYMEGTGGEEYRWIRDALQEDKDIECVAMIADQQYVQRPRLVRVGDSYRGYPATREELLQFDCVICSDISRGAFTREQLEWTVELVAKRGGGFAMIGGHTSFGSGGWDQTSWDQLIPIDMAGGRIGQGWVYHTFHARVPKEVEQHPVWRIVEDPDQNRQVLDRMPQFLGTNYMQRLKPAATALAMSAEPIPGVGVMPVFAGQPYGRGRTFAFAPDSTADWGRFFESQWGEGDNRYFRRFWRNVVRWLAENSEAGVKRVRVETDRVIHRLGQPIELSARAFDAEMRETTRYSLTARLVANDEASVAPGSPAGSPGTPSNSSSEQSSLAFPLSVTPDGQSYTATVDSQRLVPQLDFSHADSTVLLSRRLEVIATDEGQEVGRAIVNVQLLPDSRELERPQASPAILERLADRAGGKVLRTVDELSRIVGSLPVSRGDVVVSRTPLWDHPALWAVILLLLSMEWIMRRRAGYA